MSVLDDWIARAQQERVSDVHIVAGLPVRGRVDGRLLDLTETPMSWEDCENVGRELAGSRFSEIERMGEVDLAKSFPCGVRTRINLFRQQGSLSAAIRLLAERIPELEELQLPPAVSNFENYRTGIVLVTGETGSGKSTTLASVLNRINHTRQAHIITLEDPIEYLHRDRRSIVSQREIAIDTTDYLSALRACLRQAPDVILLGEMRDHETIRTAMTAAETGHLLIATLHTNGAVNTIDRIIDSFPSTQQSQIRVQLSMVLRTVVSQRLLPDVEGGLVPAYEIMHMNAAIRSMIRDCKNHQIDNVIAAGGGEGMKAMDQSILELYQAGIITRETAMDYADHPEQMLRRLG